MLAPEVAPTVATCEPKNSTRKLVYLFYLSTSVGRFHEAHIRNLRHTRQEVTSRANTPHRSGTHETEMSEP